MPVLLAPLLLFVLLLVFFPVGSVSDVVLRNMLTNAIRVYDSLCWLMMVIVGSYNRQQEQGSIVLIMVNRGSNMDK